MAPLGSAAAPPRAPHGRSRSPADEAALAGLADELLEAVSAVRRQGRRHAARPVELAPLTGAQLELVRVLRRHPGLSVAEAAAELRLAANTVSTLVGQLAEAGLVVRRTDPDDRRVARLALRGDVARKVSAWRDRRVLAVARAVGGLPEADLHRLSEAVPVLRRLAAALDEGGEAEGSR